MKYAAQMSSIRDNSVYCEMLGWYEESGTQFDRMPQNLEGTDKPAHEAISRAYFAAGHALDAVIDAHCAQQAVVMMQEYKRGSVPINALADLLSSAENEKEDGLYKALHRFRDAWNALENADRQGAGPHDPGRMKKLDAACERAERGVIAAVQEYARRLAAPPE